MFANSSSTPSPEGLQLRVSRRGASTAVVHRASTKEAYSKDVAVLGRADEIHRHLAACKPA